MAGKNLKIVYRGVLKGLDNTSANIADFSLKQARRWNFKQDEKVKSHTLDPQFEKEVIRYWKQYTRDFDPVFHKFYSAYLGDCDVRYIPDDLYFTKIDPHFSNHRFARAVADKNYFSLWYPEVRQPATVVRKINGIFYTADYEIISAAEALERCSAQERIIIKPAIGKFGGKGIQFWEKADTLEYLKKYLTATGSYSNLIVQEIVRQHELIKQMNPTSLNTIRATTMLFQGEAYNLSTCLRIGATGSNVDNVSSGGYSCGIKENGQLRGAGYSRAWIKADRNAQGFLFSDLTVPSYDKILTMTRQLQIKMAHFRIISWDIAIGEDGELILIEANLNSGGISPHQICNGPLFGDLTEAVLEEVFLGK